MDELRPVMNRTKAFRFRLGVLWLACLLAGLALTPPLARAAQPADELLDIRGVVVDTKDPPTPLVGVTVLVQGTVRGTTTDAEGFFSIKAKHDDVLTFSFIGYKGKEYRVNRSVANLSITMEEELTSIDQVVVTGMTA